MSKRAPFKVNETLTMQALTPASATSEPDHIQRSRDSGEMALETEQGLRTLVLEHVPEGHVVVAGLFRNLRNAEFLHSQLLARNRDFEYAFIDASVIVSRLQVLAAAYKAVNAHLAGSLRTPNVHAETVACLSPSNNIADAYRRFGLGPKSTDLVVLKIHLPDGSDSAPGVSQAAAIEQAIKSHLMSNIDGDAVPFDDENLEACADWAKVRKLYKLNGLPWLDGQADDALRKQQLARLVLSTMALKGL